LVMCRLIMCLLWIGGGISPGVVVDKSSPVGMSFDAVGLPDGAGSGPRVSRTSSVAFSRFV